MSHYTICLDLSTKPGYAIYRDGDLAKYDTLFAEHTVDQLGDYPFSYLVLAEKTIDRLFSVVFEPLLKETSPEDFLVIIEETTASSQNYSQKRLEFIHMELLRRVRAAGINRVRYIRDAVWKRLVGATQSKEERNYNARIARYKKKNNKKIAKLKLNGSDKEVRVRKLDAKDYALRALRDITGIELTREYEDAADAIMLGHAFYMGAPVCDGTITGGILTDEMKSTILKELEDDSCGAEELSDADETTSSDS